ncbi:hypothetical protein BH11MYX4_BH11MYX4_39140 [soil metagenome]
MIRQTFTREEGHVRYPHAVPDRTLSPADLEALATRTLAHYDNSAPSFAAATRAHDVSQNYDALLRARED